MQIITLPLSEPEKNYSIMTKILVTGSAGQLGNSLKSISDTYQDFEFIHTDIDNLDISNEKAVNSFISDTKPDFLVNCAGYTAVDKAESDKAVCFLLNSEATEILGNVCLANGVKFIHISTDYVFSGKSFTPYNEADDTLPATVYGMSKLEGENRIKSLENAMIIRTSWLYSLYGNNFFRTILRLCKEKNEIDVVFDQIGTPTFAPDLAQAILEIIDKCTKNPDNFKTGIYHYSGEGVCSWYDFAWAINYFSGNKCNVKAVKSIEFPRPAKRPAYSVLDKTKIKTAFDLSIPNWIESLQKAIGESGEK